jgi:carboxymethylenebutenolidase
MAGVLVLHAWWGLNDDVRTYARRLESEGFAVETPDLYGGGRVVTEIPAAEALMKAREKDRLLTEIDGAAERLGKLGTYAVLGWSMGGSYGWDLLSRRPGTVAALVDHYGGGEPEAGAVLPPILGHYGELDDDPPVAMVRDLEKKLRDLGAPAEFHYYPGAKHWFAEPSRPQYDPNAAARAWDRTLRFLKQHLG